jgi:cell division protein FtsB
MVLYMCLCVQVSSLVAEVAAKQEQLQALEAEHEALTAKARALDQMVASAGWCSACGYCATQQGAVVAMAREYLLACCAHA